MNLFGWFASIWPPEPRRVVVEDYRAIGKFALTDIALRGSVWDGAPPGLTLFDAGVFEGRRQMALEIIRISGSKPGELYGLVPQAGETDDGGRNRFGRRTG